MVKIGVIGAGINGLSSAVKIKEYFKDTEVVLISDEFTPNTTGDGSGGLWYPYLCGATSEKTLLKWGHETYRLYHKLWLEGGFDICLQPMYSFCKDNSALRRPEWANVVFGYQILNSEQLKYYNILHNNDFRSGLTFSTFVVNPPTILKYFFERFKRANGKILRAKVTSLSDPLLNDYDVLVNCTGLGARNLVPDSTVFPIRGQISKVLAPWMNQVVVNEDDGNYIIPNVDFCVMGGTHQEHNYSTQVDAADAEFITKGCSDMIPALKKAELLTQWVGLRPGRHEVRLDSEVKGTQLIIHNYGHGGSGLTLFWGCAKEVLDILKEKLTASRKSKL